jgi:hypothetical protein
METKEIAQKLVQWCKEGNFENLTMNYTVRQLSVLKTKEKAMVALQRVLKAFRKRESGGKKILKYITLKYQSLWLPIIGFLCDLLWTPHTDLLVSALKRQRLPYTKLRTVK